MLREFIASSYEMSRLTAFSRGGYCIHCRRAAGRPNWCTEGVLVRVQPGELCRRTSHDEGRPLGAPFLVPHAVPTESSFSYVIARISTKIDP